MRRLATLEKAVQRRILARMNKVPKLVIRKKHGTVMGLAGDPDLYGAYRGKAFAFEVKRPNDPSSVPTKLQTVRLDEWAAAGAIVGVVRSPEDVLRFLGIVPAPAPVVVWICASCRKYRFDSAQAPAACKLCGGTKFDEEAIR